MSLRNIVFQRREWSVGEHCPIGIGAAVVPHHPRSAHA